MGQKWNLGTGSQKCYKKITDLNRKWKTKNIYKKHKRVLRTLDLVMTVYIQCQKHNPREQKLIKMTILKFLL